MILNFRKGGEDREISGSETRDSEAVEHKDVGGTNSGWKTSEDDWCHSNSRTLTNGSITLNSKHPKDSTRSLRL